MVKELQHSETAAQSPHRHVSTSYLVVAAVVFAVTFLLIGQVHRHRTKAANGTLMDGEEHIALAQDHLVGDDELPTEYRTALAETLRSGSLYPAPAAAIKPVTAAKPAPQEPEAFRLLTPVNATVVSDQPLLDWEDLDDAQEYKVSVFDASGRLIEESPVLSTSAWRPVAPLDRGQEYHWVVTARMGDRDVRVPAEGQPNAVFRIAPQTVADKLLLAQAKYPDHHLLLATLFARAGDTQVASRELDLAEEQDAGHPLLVKLKASLRQRR